MATSKQANGTNENLSLYNKLRGVPTEAKKLIESGRLKGKTDINPMYRIKIMTEAFGPCGIGWKYEIVKQWQEQYGSEVKAFTNVNLFYKQDGQWSEPIPGTGGATLVELNKNGNYVNDEGFKMSLTDALSVAMKAVGVAADVYYEKDMINFESKYETGNKPSPAQQQVQQPAPQQASAQQIITPTQEILNEIAAANTHDDLMAIWNKYPACQKHANFTGALTARKDQINGSNKS